MKNRFLPSNAITFGSATAISMLHITLNWSRSIGNSGIRRSNLLAFSLSRFPSFYFISFIIFRKADIKHAAKVNSWLFEAIVQTENYILIVANAFYFWFGRAWFISSIDLPWTNDSTRITYIKLYYSETHVRVKLVGPSEYEGGKWKKLMWILWSVKNFQFMSCVSILLHFSSFLIVIDNDEALCTAQNVGFCSFYLEQSRKTTHTVDTSTISYIEM